MKAVLSNIDREIDSMTPLQHASMLDDVLAGIESGEFKSPSLNSLAEFPYAEAVRADLYKVADNLRDAAALRADLPTVKAHMKTAGIKRMEEINRVVENALSLNRTLTTPAAPASTLLGPGGKPVTPAVTAKTLDIYTDVPLENIDIAIRDLNAMHGRAGTEAEKRQVDFVRQKLQKVYDRKLGTVPNALKAYKVAKEFHAEKQDRIVKNKLIQGLVTKIKDRPSSVVKSLGLTAGAADNYFALKNIYLKGREVVGIAGKQIKGTRFGTILGEKAFDEQVRRPLKHYLLGLSVLDIKGHKFVKPKVLQSTLRKLMDESPEKAFDLLGGPVGFQNWMNTTDALVQASLKPSSSSVAIKLMQGGAIISVGTAGLASAFGSMPDDAVKTALGSLIVLAVTPLVLINILKSPIRTKMLIEGIRDPGKISKAISIISTHTAAAEIEYKKLQGPAIDFYNRVQFWTPTEKEQPKPFQPEERQRLGLPATLEVQ